MLSARRCEKHQCLRDQRAAHPVRSRVVRVQAKSVVVVGGGWAGFGAALHLSSQGYNVS